MDLGVAFVSREYPPQFGGGIGTYARHMAPALARAGVRVHVVTQAADEAHARTECNGRLTVHRVSLRGSASNWTGANLRFAAAAGRRVAELAAEGTVQVAEFPECEAPGIAACAASAAGATGSLGIVVHLHTPTDMLLRLGSINPGIISPGIASVAEASALLGADIVCAPSRFIAVWARRRYDLASEPDVIPYAHGPLPALSTDARERAVLFVGRLEARKGVEPLVRAWASVSSAFPGWTLRLAGADTSAGGVGAARSMRETLAALLPTSVRDSVRFLGALPPAALEREYARASLAVVPSLWENYPNTCMEAMGHEIPVLVSDEGGMCEMFGDSAAGVTFRSGDPDDIARRLADMLREGDSALRARGAEARRRIELTCEPARIALARIAIYERAIESAARRADPAPRLRAWRLWESLARGVAEPLGPIALDERISRWTAQEALA